MSSRAQKQKMLESLRELVQESLRLRQQGSSGSKLSHVLGMIDGSMRVMLDAELASQKDLLSLVAEERARCSGSPIAVLDPPSFQAA
jgi:hypothetical protein